MKLDFQASFSGLAIKKTWQERKADQRQAFDECRSNIFRSYVSRQPLDEHTKCDSCHKSLKTAAIRCITCKQHFCWKCDYNLHSSNPFHNRFFATLQLLQPLKSLEFYEKDWNCVIKGNTLIHVLILLNLH